MYGLHTYIPVLFFQSHVPFLNNASLYSMVGSIIIVTEYKPFFFSFHSTFLNFLTRRIEGVSGGSLPSILSELAVLDLLLMFGKPRPGNEDGGFGDQFRLVSQEK